MTTFTGTSGNDVADATSGTLTGFTGGTVAQLQDATGDTFTGLAGADTIVAGSGNDTITGGGGSDVVNGGAGDDIINLANGDFAAGESIDGGANNDTILLTNATTVDFSTGLITNVETLGGSSGNDAVTISVSQWTGVATIDLDGGTDTLTANVSGSVDISSNGLPTTIANVETGSLTGTGGSDSITLTGAQLDAIIIGSGTINLGAGAADTINLTSTSTDLNALGLVDLSIQGVEVVSAAGAGAGVTINLSSQSEGFTITGSAFGDTLAGGSGNDLFIGFGGSDTIAGGAGTDTISLQATSTDLNAAGDAQIVAAEVVDASTAGSGLIIDLSNQTEGLKIVGSNFADVLTGGLGNDTIIGGGGADTMNGNGGGDTFNLANGDFAVGESIDGKGGTDSIVLTNPTIVDFSTGTVENVENLTGSIATDVVTIRGSHLYQFTTINLNGGTNDTLNVLADGYDISQSAFPTITNVDIGNLIGTSGDDVIALSGAQLDAILSGTATINFGAGSFDTLDLTSTSSDLNLLGAADASIQGVEYIAAYNALAGVTISMNGQSEALNILGGAGADTLTGGSGADTIVGGAGNDIITGGAGADTLTGGLGADTFVIGAVADLAAGETIDGTAEAATNDTLRLDAAGSYNLSTFATISNIDAIALNQNAVGFNLTVSDSQVSTADANDNGVAGDLQISAALAMTQGVTINASGLTGTNHIVVVGTNLGGNDTITGGAGADVIDGGAGADTIVGGAGDDIITGGAGADNLTGGLGADTFVATPGSIAVGEIIDGTAEAATDDTLRFDAPAAYNFTGFTTISNIDDILFNANAAGFGMTVVDSLVSTADANNDGTAGDLQIGAALAMTQGVTISASGLTGTNHIVVDGTNLGGNDAITGGAGADVIAAGVGSDTINGFVGADTVDGGLGADTIVLTATSTSLNSASDAQIVNVETVTAVGAGAGVTINLSNQTEDISIRGSLSADTITGGSGDDTIVEFINADQVNGGAGTDTIVLDSGSITSFNSATDAQIVNVEVIDARPAAGSQTGTTVNLSAQTEAAGFTIIPTSSQDSITGSSGNDAFIGFSHFDSYNGGPGWDTLVLTASVEDDVTGSYWITNRDGGSLTSIEAIDLSTATEGVLLNLGAWAQPFTVTGSAFGDQITGTSLNDTIFGGNGSNTLAGGAGADIIVGGTSADTITGGAGADTLTGGLGADTFVIGAVADLAAGETIDGTAEAATNDTLRLDAAGSYNLSTFATISNIDAIALNQNAVGFNLTVSDSQVSTADANNDGVAGDLQVSAALAMTQGVTINASGLTGTNHIVVVGTNLGGNDTITGGTGADAISTGAGNDTINGFVGADTVDGGLGADTIALTATSTSLNSASDAQIVNIETISATGAGSGVSISLSNQSEGFTIQGSVSDDNIVGSAGNDTITGGSGADIIGAGAGNDIITGGSGADTLTGGLGADTFVIGAVADLAAGETIDGTAEAATNDTLRLDAAGSYNLSAFATISNIDAIALNQNAVGFNLTVSDSQVSTADANDNGVAGDLQISAALAMTQGVTINASGLTGTNHIVVVGTNLGGNDTITGGAGADVIDGGAGADTIVGGAGDDIITGGAGADNLTGGLGADTFIATVGSIAVGEIIDGTAEAATDDMLRLDAAGTYNFTGFTTVSNIDDILFNANAAGFNLTVVDSQVSTADANNDGTTGDLQIGAALAIAQGVTISASGLTGTNHIVVDGTNLGGNDTITGGSGADTIVGGAGNDIITGGAGADTLTGGLGADTFVIGAVADLAAGETIDGTAEAATNDTLRLDAAGSYNLSAFATISNIDAIALNQNAVGFNLTVSDSQVSTADANDNGVAGDLQISAALAMTQGVTINASGLTGTNHIVVVGTNLGGNDTITGGAGADVIDGGAGADTIVGGAGDDVITGGAGADNVTGGLGADTFVIGAVADLAAGETINGTAEAATDDTLRLDAAGTYNFTGFTTISNIDDILFNANAAGFNLTVVDSLVSTADANNDGTAGDLQIGAALAMTQGVTISASGLTGTNHIVVDGTNLGGNDAITGGAGADVIAAGVGSDTINGFVGADTVDGGLGADTIVLTATSTSLNSASDAQIVNVETVTAVGAGAGVTINLSNQTEDISIRGSLSADTITGGSGDDTIVEFINADQVNGGAGTDTIVLDSGSITSFNSATDAQIVNVEVIDARPAAGSQTGTTVNLSAQTEAAGFTIIPTSSQDSITGSSGNDAFIGFSHFDSYNGGPGWDTLVLTASVEDDVTGSYWITNRDGGSLTSIEAIDLSTATEGVLLNLGAWAQPFTVTGSAFGDQITGTSLNDTIFGGAGNDVLNGGAGVDTAIYSGAWIDYAITLAGSVYSITDHRAGSPDGTDSVTNVENFTFSNGTFTAAQILNDAPVAVPDTAIALEASGHNNATPGSNPSGFVLTNDTDADSSLGDTKAVQGVMAGTQSGPLSTGVGSAVAGSFGSLVVNADGSYTYSVDNANSAVEALNVGDHLTDKFSYTVMDAGGLTSTTTITVTVNGANDAPPQSTDSNGAANSIAEGAANGTSVGLTALSVDVDSPPVSYVLSDDAGGRFAIDGSSGIVTVANGSLLDYETATSHQITVKASDASGAFTTQDFTIGVTDVAPSTPTDSNAAANSVAEGSANGTPVGITASSADVNGGTVSYVLSDDAGGRFAIDGSSGIVTVANGSLLDYETATSHQITVKASDASGAFTTQDFTIGVTDVAPSTPTDSNAAANSVAEGSANGTPVGITASSADVNGGTVSYVLSDDAGGRFAIDGSSGIVTVANGSLLDYETATSHQITVKASDASGAFTTQDFTIGVTDVAPSTPTDSNAAANSVAEGSANGTPVGITASSADVNGGTVSYVLSDDAGGRFAIDGSSGIVTVANGSLLDYETATSHQITVKASDASGAFTTQDFTIGVTDVVDTNVIYGTNNNEILTGTAGNDLIYALAGDDTVNAGAGDDTIVGGAGNDTLSGGAGSDTYEVGLSAGYDKFNDTGLSGTDRIVATADGVAIGIQSGFGPGSGLEEISANGHANVTIKGSDSSNDILNFSSTTLTGIVKIDGGAGDDSITGSSGDDTIVGGAGNDTLSGGAGSDTYEVGLSAGYDKFNDTGLSGTDRIVATADGVAIGIQSGFGPGSGLEEISANGHANVTIKGSDSSNDIFDFSSTTLTGIVKIDGGAGDDSITGSSGDDTIVGGAGNDTLSGGAGSDTYEVGLSAGYDKFNDTGLSGTDRIVATADGVAIGIQSGFGPGSGLEEISANGHANVTIKGSDSSNDIFDFSSTTLTGIVKIDGGAGDDSITGSSGDDTIVGGAGNDTLSGGAGSDTYEVGLSAGYDKFNDTGLSGTDRIVATADGVAIGIQSGFGPGSGLEEISANGHANVTIKGSDSSNDILNFSSTTLTGIVKIDGGAGDDSITGSSGDDTIVGGAGNDTLSGGAGSDTYEVGLSAGYDKFNDTGLSGTDRIVATADGVAIGIQSGFGPGSGLEEISANGHANVTIKGSDSSNDIFNFSSTTLTGIVKIDGGAGDDSITGSSGDDTIVGGAGHDTLSGGAGADAFVFGPAAAASNDKILDFVTGVDKLQFMAADYGLSAGMLDAAHLVFGTAAVDNHSEFVYNAAAGNLMWDADGVGGAGLVIVATLVNNTAIAHTDMWFM